jgi:hypothetical protein
LTLSTENLIPETEDEGKRAAVDGPAPRKFRITEQTLAVINALREGYRSVDKRGHIINEAETRMLLISPILEVLGFPPTHRRPEDGNRGNRPDEICYDREVEPNLGPAAVILEAKALGSPFDLTERSGPRTSSPDRQIQRYLRQHVASGPSTIGVLTDGLRWRLYELSGANADVAFLEEYDFAPVARQFWRSLDSFDASEIRQFEAFIESTTRCFTKPEPPVLVAEADPVIDLFNVVANSAPPGEILRHLVLGDEIEPRYDIGAQVALGGAQEDMYENDWEDDAYLVGPQTEPAAQPSLSDQLTVAAVRFRYSEVGLGRGDTAMSARLFARAAGSGMSVLLIYSTAPDGSVEARLAACAEGRVNMTAAFDPELPLPSARAAIGQIIATLSSGKVLSADDILEPLEVAPLRQRFYQEVSEWTWRLQRDQSLAYRQAVLKHLIRVIFAWILKEEDIIPPDLFEYAYVANNLDTPNSYHADVLSYLFHERLNVVDAERSPHAIASLNEVLDNAPFLNGSLFAKSSDDIDLELTSDLYWNTKGAEPGLFTIFSRYHWTTDEHRPGESEQTLDPELLSNLFEQLITPTEEGKEPPPRQPRGTYYTPADVADEMVKDALLAAVRGHAPENVTDRQLLELFGDSDTKFPELEDKAKSKLAERIAKLRIFDPAVGSGEFLFSCLIALKTALNKLNGRHSDTTREIVKNQLSGQDINAIATQIARLRLFIAIKSAEKGVGNQEPLPNLEARIVCADTLETIADPDWRPGRPASLGDCEPDFAVSLAELANNRQRWFDAHTEKEKSELRAIDAALRLKLTSYLNHNGNDAVTSPELKGFIEYPLLSTSIEYARTDARLLFYEPDRDGFDIVIGNPPYEGLAKSIDSKRRASLIEDKKYATTGCNNLYTLFCEAALALAKRDGGVVTMIVPLSIAFGQRQRSLRQLFEDRCGRIDLRHYDNRPDTTFNESPTVKSPSNSQRTTIVIVKISDNTYPMIQSTGLQRWASADRKSCLKQRDSTDVSKCRNHIEPRISGQWPRVATSQVAMLVEVLNRQSRTIGSFIARDGQQLAMPKTAGYFINVIPSGTITPRNETTFTVADPNALRLAMATINGHIGYAWWRIFGDSFHINRYEIASLTVPDAWINQPDTVADLVDELLVAIPDCIVEMKKVGKIWRNVNFHLKPDLIEELDRLHIEALGLDVEPLLTHLKIMRSSSSWDFEGAG